MVYSLQEKYVCVKFQEETRMFRVQLKENGSFRFAMLSTLNLNILPLHVTIIKKKSRLLEKVATG